MADEPNLPQLPAGIISRPSKRARFQHSSPQISSDPPLFSSDDDPSADNYFGPHGHQKKKYRGPWFKQEPAESSSSNAQRAKRTFQRQFDSAVWLGSDDTDGDADTQPVDVSNPSGLQERILPMRPRNVANKAPQEIVQLVVEDLARRRVDSCLEQGTEIIDLTLLDLGHLSNATIKPLESLVPVPVMARDVPFQNLTPSLKIFLASNRLTRLPGEIFNLENLKVLSVRKNQLRELPAAIGKLGGLVELNVSMNRLSTLPYEILQLFSDSSSLQSLHLHPNMFYEPEGYLPRYASQGSGSQSPRLWDGWNINYKCRTFVRFIDMDGTLVQGPALPETSLFVKPTRGTHYRAGIASSIRGLRRIPVAPYNDIPTPPSRIHTVGRYQKSNAPSLLETAVKLWSKEFSLPSSDGINWLDYNLPEKLSKILEDAQTLREAEAGERRCTKCARTFVIPRTEWIEWWEISKGQENKELASAASPLRHFENKRDIMENMVPLMRRGCSWKCLPDSVAVVGFGEGVNKMMEMFE